MVEEIVHNDKLLAIIIKSSFAKEGIEFFTPSHFSQQLGYMKRLKGYKVEAHSHKIVERKVFLTQEVLVIKSGKIEVRIFENDENFIALRILTSGDIILMAQGGHSIEMLEDTEIIEVKQGPYTKNDKIKITEKKYDECSKQAF